jgi:hypothetical protein
MSNRIVIAGVVLGILASACLVSRRVHLRRQDTRDITDATRSTVESLRGDVNPDAAVWPAS